MAASSSSPASALLITTIVLAGCAGSRSTIGDGQFQKRHLRPGWHVDLGGRDRLRTADREVHVARMEPRSRMYLDLVSTTPAPAIDRTEQDNPIASAEPLSPALPDLFNAHLTGPTIQAFAPDTTRTAQRQAIEDPAHRWNPWAIPALVAAGGTVALALATGTSLILVVLGVIVTLLLASIALRKGRKNEWSGKGFAVAAMIVGVLAALITLIAVLAGGG